MDRTSKFLAISLFCMLGIGLYVGDNQLEAKEDKDKDKNKDRSGSSSFASALSQQEYTLIIEIKDTLKLILEEEKKQTELLWCIASGYIEESYYKTAFDDCHEEYIKWTEKNSS